MWRTIALFSLLSLAATPASAAEDDPEARASRIDRLIWSRQFDAADRELDIALSLQPNAPALLTRRARLLHFRGDTGLGRPYLVRAERLAPNDGDIRALGDRMWLGEARLRTRYDVYPSGWDNIPTGELSIYQRIGRAMIGVRSEHSRRPVTAYGGGTYNAFYAGSLQYTVAVGWAVGVEGGFGAPARAVPEALGRAYLYFPIHGPFDGYAAYTYMTYASGTSVHMINPAIGFQITDALRIDARYWLARAWLPGGDARTVHSVGSYAIYRVVPRFAIDALYVYGTQLDRIPAAFQLGEIRSHFIAVGLDVLLARSFGMRPQYQLEIRRNPNGDVINIHSGELAVYVRW